MRRALFAASALVLAALEKERVKGEFGATGVGAQVRVRRGAAWARGPLAEAYHDGALLDLRGDAITVLARSRLDDDWLSPAFTQPEF